MPSSLSRGPITTRVIAECLTEGFPVGDNESPDQPYGWQGEPNDNGTRFIPWMVITPGVASPLSPPGAMGDTGTMWRVSYNLFLAGVSRKQTEALGDRIRNALTNITREKVTTPTGDWKIQKISCMSVGTNNRVSSGYPDYFTQSDSYEVMITKG